MNIRRLLDPATAEQAMVITNDIVHERNLTTLMITHNMGQALTTGSRNDYAGFRCDYL